MKDYINDTFIRLTQEGRIKDAVAFCERVAAEAPCVEFQCVALKNLAEVPENIEELDDFELADLLSRITGTAIPKAVEEIRIAPILHDKVVDASDMPQAVCDFLF